MTQKIPEFIKMEMLKLFENPRKQYLKFSKSIRQDMETKSFKTFTSRLNCFIDILSSSDMPKEIATKKIEEFVNQGIMEILNLTDNSISIAKAQVCVYLPYLLRDVIGNVKNDYRLRIEGTKLINNLLEQNSLELRAQIETLKKQRTICDDVGTLISNAADFELQAQILEMLFRLVPASERTESASSWFSNEELQNLFLSIEDKTFEPGCRKFLNKLNESKKGCSVFSIPCQTVLFGSQQIPLAKDVGSGNYWLDFNYGSKTLKFFLEEKEEGTSENEVEDIWWRTVVIELDNVADCNLFEQKDGTMLKITLKEDVASLIPSWSPSDVHTVQIKLGSKCNRNALREVLESFSWICPDHHSSSPKASVAIFSVHLADRQNGQMEVVPTVDSKPPEALMEEDIDDNDLINSDITASLEERGTKETKELLSSSNVQDTKPLQDLQKTKSTSTSQGHLQDTDSLDSNSKENAQELKAGHSYRDVNDNFSQITLRSSNIIAAEGLVEHTPSSVDEGAVKTTTETIEDVRNEVNHVIGSDHLNKKQGVIEDQSNKDVVGKKDDIQKKRGRNKNKKSISPREKTRSRDDSESGAESSSSRRSLRRSPRGHGTNKKIKSPLPVEIIKGDKRRSSSSSGKSSTESENGGNSPAKNVPAPPKKTYPKAFNVDKRMQAKKNNISSNSQEIKKKVFGQGGSSFGQKTTLHIMAPARRADYFKEKKSPPSKDKSSRRLQSQTKRTKTKEADVNGDSSERTGIEDNEKKMVQDSMPPLDESPEATPVRRRSDVPKLTEKAVTDDHLTRSEPSKRTKQRVQFENSVPTRIGTILRKGGRKERDSLLDESKRSGWGSTSTSSTSETDWPGPDVEPGPKAKHSLVPCKSVRETRYKRGSAAEQSRTKRASVSPGLSAISEEKSPLDIQQDEPRDYQLPSEQTHGKPPKSFGTKKGEKGFEGLEDEEKRLESGNSSEDTILYESTSNRKTRGDGKTSGKAKVSTSKASKTKESKNQSSAGGSSHKTKDKQDVSNFEEEFDFDLPDLTVLALEEPLVDEVEPARESVALPSNPISSKGDHDDEPRKKSAAKADISLDDNDDEKGSDVGYAASQELSRDKDDESRGQGEGETLGESQEEKRYQENRNQEKKLNERRDSRYLKSTSQKDDKRKTHQKSSKRGFSGDELDEDSDFHVEHTSPKRRKTYSTKQRQQYTKTMEENWTKDKDTGNKKRSVSLPNMGWQSYPSSKQDGTRTAARKESSKESNKSGEAFHDLQSGYESEDHDSDHSNEPRDRVQDHKDTGVDKKNETRNARSRKGRGERQQEQEQSRSLHSSSSSRLKKNQSDIDDEGEESSEVLKLRRFCQDITASKSSTPSSEFPLRKQREQETEDGRGQKRSKATKVQSKFDEQVSDQSGKSSPKRSKHQDENVNDFTDHHGVSRSRQNTNESLGTRQVKESTKYKTPSTKQDRMNDSGLGRSISTGSRKRTLVTSSTTSTTPKGRRKGELVVTTSLSKTPVTPRTSAIMRRIEEDEDFGHSKKPRQIFVDWTSSGPSRTVSSPFQEPFSPDINEDDDQEREQKKIPERVKTKGKGTHNPHIRPRQLFRQGSDEHAASGEELDDEALHEQYAAYEDMRDIADIITSLEGNLKERLRNKRQNLQRFCKRTMDVTIETITKHFEQNHSNRDKIIDSFNDQFLEEIRTLKDEMDKAKKNEEQILARIEEDMKVLKTRRILQENKIKGLRNLCVEFQSEIIKDNDSQSDHQVCAKDAFQDEIRQELVHVQENFLLEAQRQDRENLRRSLRSVLDATMM